VIRQIIVVLILFIFICQGAIGADDLRRDGNWWRSFSKELRASYVVGVFDGMYLGHEFSYWKFIKEPLARKSVDSYYEFSQKYTSNVTSGQLADGLDSFYEDYRNRSIVISDGVSA
jgi:hypothetical protein